MYCQYCGKEISEGTLKCPECGKSLEEKIESEPTVKEVSNLRKELGNDRYDRVKKIYKQLLPIEIIYLTIYILTAFFSFLILAFNLNTLYMLWPCLLFILLVAYIIQAIDLFKSKDLNNHLKNAFMITVIGIVVNVLDGFNLFGNYINNLISIFSNTAYILVIIAIAKSIEDFAYTSGNEMTLAKEAHDNATLNTVLAIVIGCFAAATIDFTDSLTFYFIALIAYIKYLILLIHTNKRL